MIDASYSTVIRPNLLCERSSWRSYTPWRQETYHRSARLEKQLKVLEDQIDKQVKRFQTQYSRASNPTRPKDVAKLLAPSSTPPLELATLSWLGDWRPSSILGLLSSLTRSSPTLASSLTHAAATEKAIQQLIHDLRIEEAVIDEELTEIQANCILNLPFALAQGKLNGPTMDQVHSELKKVHRLILKAQNFRSNLIHINDILIKSRGTKRVVFAGWRLQPEPENRVTHMNPNAT
ncbi:putative transcription factor TGA like domain-containing protein [Helianthus anomalus]